ncbi:hypothetical protein PR202_ga14084 [Eleusine coracana subsp. coracana]|uniref:Late embryogenesis abundant protein LEA-2 subgroup domain-containing protein n=1 Tax=Eleusine coracana subsp. coracana TaxID=191504 RepID=A0AAV5CFP0_ELECO|nr:hypothetical protein QOZ80_3AG0209260 [Eleusine coracana subsp. coracana]GJM97177.1 hypothetical protein PR202_ga14084 [Eleusine coracana subsp. coracana]
MGECDECCGDCPWTKIIIGAVVLAILGGVIAVLVIAFAVVYPPKASADNVLLHRFELQPGTPADNSTISYDIAATLSLRNPNIYRSISYGPMTAAFSFNGSRFDESGTVRELENGARKKATITLKVGGADKGIKLSDAGVKEFRKQNETGKFDVELRLDTVLQYKGRKTKCPLVIVCPLELQLVDPDVAATAFQKTKCTMLRAKKSGC